MTQLPKSYGMCPECKKGKMILEIVEGSPGFPKEYTYRCPLCGYKIIEH